jgi:histidyl-tRNA synthetase
MQISASMAADAEICMMAADTMEALGIPRGSYIVKVNNRKVLDGVREAIGVSDDTRWLTVMRAIDKLDRLGVAGVQALLGEGRKDESGDFTKGAGLRHEDIVLVTSIVEPADDIENKLAQIALRLRDSKVGQEGLEELEEIRRLVEASEYGRDRIRIDPSVVRGLEYYTGPVYEVELLLETNDEKGRPVRFGSVGGGGRYDGLVSRFRGEAVPATGFSIGVSRLQAALTMIGKLDTKPQAGPVVVTVFGGDIAAYQKMVARLRGAGIRAELYLGNPKHSLGQQMKYADKRNSPCAIIQGSDERAQGKVQIKDLILGAGLTTIEDREEYLRKQSEAQLLVEEEKLVEAVREILERHDVRWS